MKRKKKLKIVVFADSLLPFKMPLFKKGGASFSYARKNEDLSDKKAQSSPKSHRNSKQASGASNNYTSQVAKPSRNAQNPQASVATLPEEHPPDPSPRFVFYCQLAHGSATGKVEGFTNVKELYEKIAETHSISVEQILFCTLNTYRVDMERLLGGQIGLDDFIFAHLKGQRKTVEVFKGQPSLGLTITDNGTGCAFIKRIKEGSTIDQVPQICIGDQIVAINGNSIEGLRHFDVARMLRELPLNEKIVFEMNEPKRGFEGIGPRSGKGNTANSLANDDAKAANTVGSGKATLRLRSKGPAVVEEEAPVWEVKAGKRIDDLLESFIGIRDQDLADELVSIGKNKDNPSDFAMHVDKRFAEFEFPDDFIFDIWGAIGDAKSGRL